jgi:hypothetical protein
MTSSTALKDVLSQKLAIFNSEDTNSLLVALGQSCLLLGQAKRSDLPSNFASYVTTVLQLMSEGNVEVQARSPDCS